MEEVVQGIDKVEFLGVTLLHSTFPKGKFNL